MLANCRNLIDRRLLVSLAILAIFVLPMAGRRSTSADSHDLFAAHEKSDSKISRDLARLVPGSVDQLQDQSNESGLFRDLDRGLRIDEGGFVIIDAIAAGDTNKLKADLEKLGLQQGAAFGGMVSGRFPVSAIASIGKLKSLRFVRPSYMLTDAGVVTSQGDAAMQSDDARNTFGLTGSGVTVGTLSDSFDCLVGAAGGVASGDLPSGIGVLEEGVCGFGIDEGRAMMEIIHDVAPGASQLFHTASGGQANFAQGIIDLRNAGANVIVDDAFYPDELFFQDGVIAQAVDTVVAGGAAYFSAAGNDDRMSYESPFAPGALFAAGDFPPGTPFAPPFGGGVAHDFGGGDVFQRVTVQPGGSIGLSYQWADSAASACTGCPGAATDMDVYILNDPPTVVLHGSSANNVGSDPVEGFGLSYTGTTPVNVNVMLVKFSGPGPLMMKYIQAGSRSTVIDEFNTASGTIFGHPNAAGAEAVGAAFYGNTPDFGVTPPLLEPFSSAGSTPIFFDTSGNAISPIVRDKPEIVAPDGANTTFFGSSDIEPDGFLNFSGTSAAAPHAAAVAALMLEATPSLTPADIYSSMEETAIDMNAPGFDFDSGFGLINAVDAVVSTDAVAPTDPTPISSSHTVNVSSSDDTVDIAWPPLDTAGGATDGLSGVDGYSWLFSQGPTDLPDEVEDNNADQLSATSAALPDGESWFHLRTVDLAENWTSTVHLGPFVINTNPIVCGDVHPAGGGDGDVDVQDALRVLKIAIDLVTPTAGEQAAGDVHPDNTPDPDGDGDIDVQDALRILKASLDLTNVTSCGGPVP